MRFTMLGEEGGSTLGRGGGEVKIVWHTSDELAQLGSL